MLDKTLSILFECVCAPPNGNVGFFWLNNLNVSTKSTIPAEYLFSVATSPAHIMRKMKYMFCIDSYVLYIVII